MQISIQEDDPTRSECLALLQVHHAHMLSHTDPDKIYALDASGLAAPGMTFWTMWQGTELVGFGALKQLAADHGEIKSMHTVAALRGRGLAGRMLDHVVGVARSRGYRRVSLETGSAEGFAAARALYVRHGFTFCGPFSTYPDDPESAFMTLSLT
ncbi:MAG: GNAT family N-acetyltransferase [Minwuia sp.]|nr:GNAT family N-acetyltransferase [Minwuia sp.]